MHYQGLCQKMQASLNQTLDLTTPVYSPFSVYYTWQFGGFSLKMNDLLQRHIEINWTGRIFCIQCGNRTNKSYAQGYCFPCFQRVPYTDLCMVKPEICHHHLGTCRDAQFAEQVCFQPHFVYLAKSSALKIGITRASNMPTRWLDQGASQAMPIMQVSSRRLSGQFEQLFAQTTADKTNWRALLKADSPRLDLSQHKQQLFQHFKQQIQTIQSQLNHDELIDLPNHAFEFDYPVLYYPSKIISHNLDKNKNAHGILHGIKGQYLIMDTGVINLRKYTGYEMQFKVS